MEPDEKTIINVKGVSLKAWERAKTAAGRNDETLGSWVSRAANLLADMEAGGREYVPGRPAEPATHDQITARIGAVGALLQGYAAMATATGRPAGRATVSKIMGSLRQLQTDNEPLPKKADPKLALPPVVRTIGVDRP